MTFGLWFRALQWTHVAFGTGYLDRFVLIEIKYLFAIYFNVWNVVEHDRFHTHAFPAFSVGLKGWYYEEQLAEDGSKHKIRMTAPYIRFISRTNNHRMLLSSKNAWSITFAGAWGSVLVRNFS